LTAVVLFAVVAWPVAGCDRPIPPDAAAPTSASAPTSRPAPSARARATAVPAATVTPRATPSATAFPDEVAVPCAGRPSAEQVLAFVRRSMGVPANARLTVKTGPLCSGTWQYTVLVQPDVDPLQVITRGPSNALTLVTAGTDVCGASVRAEAPYGLLVAAHC
jgi:hypothetical protein